MKQAQIGFSKNALTPQHMVKNSIYTLDDKLRHSEIHMKKYNRTPNNTFCFRIP